MNALFNTEYFRFALTRRPGPLTPLFTSPLIEKIMKNEKAEASIEHASPRRAMLKFK